MVKDHSDSEKGNPLPPHRLLFLINSKGSFICLCYTSRGALAGTEIAQWVHSTKDRSNDPSHHERTLLPQSYISLLIGKYLFCKYPDNLHGLTGFSSENLG